jgi:hypothetical protein
MWLTAHSTAFLTYPLFIIIIIIIIISGSRLSPLGTATTIGLFIVPAPDDRWWWLWSNWWHEDWQVKPVLGENLLQRHFFTTNPTWPGPGSNPGRSGGEPVSNLLRYGAARHAPYWFEYWNQILQNCNSSAGNKTITTYMCFWKIRNNFDAN